MKKRRDGGVEKEVVMVEGGEREGKEGRYRLF